MQFGKGINRVIFQKQLPFYVKVSRSYILGMSSIILGYLYSLRMKKRYIFYLVFILLYFILSSEKYGMLTFFISNFFIGNIFLKKNMQINKSYIVISTLILLLILNFHYTKIENFGSKNPYQNIILRVGNGGQVFWKIDYNLFYNLKRKTNENDELKEYLKINKNNNIYRNGVGMKSLMKKIVKPQILNSWKKLSFKSLAFGNPAILLHYFGYVSFPLQILLIMGWIFITRYIIIYSLKYMAFLELFLLAYILNYEGPIFVQGDFQILFSSEYLIIFTIIVTSILLQKKFFKISERKKYESNYNRK